MHVLYFHQYFVPPGGAGGTRSLEMARRLTRRGHRVTLITSDAFFPAGERLRVPVARLDYDGIAVIALREPYSNRQRFRRRLLAFARFAVRAARHGAGLAGVDVVIATSTPLTIALPGIWAARVHRVPFVFEVRDLWPEIPIAVGALRGPVAIGLAKGLERLAYRSARAIIALSPGMKDGIVRAGIPPERVVVIPNGCDLELFGDLESPAERGEGVSSGDFARPLRVVYAGTFGRINGVGYLARIARECLGRQPAIDFVAIGDGFEREDVMAEASRLGVLGVNLQILPQCAKRDVAEAFRAADITISLFVDQPAMWTNSANKFFDGLAAGRPVVINYEGWQADLLRRTGAGWVLPPADPKEAANALLELASDRERLTRMGAAARDLAQRQFSRDRLGEQFCEVLEMAASSPRALG